MNHDNEKIVRKTSVAFMCAIIGRFMTLHREAYGSNPAPHEVTNFCFFVAQDYDGDSFDINSDKSQKFVINCMEKARTERHAQSIT